MFRKIKRLFAKYSLLTPKRSVKPSAEEIRSRLQRNAKNGAVEDQFRYALFCLVGRGGPVNTGHGIYWLNQAANQGNATAQYYLGVMYHEGYILNKDPDNATYWLTLAAVNGNAEAASCLGDFESRFERTVLIESELDKISQIS